MDLKPVVEKLKAFVDSLNEKGVPLPMTRDPNTGRASMTATMTWISFNTALLGQLGKLTNIIGPVDLSQANYLFLMCLGAYLGRRMQGDSAKKTVVIEAPESPAAAEKKDG